MSYYVYWSELSSATFLDEVTNTTFTVSVNNWTCKIDVRENPSGTTKIKLVSVVGSGQSQKYGEFSGISADINSTYSLNNSGSDTYHSYDLVLPYELNDDDECVETGSYNLYVSFNRIASTTYNGDKVSSSESTSEVSRAFSKYVTSDDEEHTIAKTYSLRAYVDNLIDISKVYYKYKVRTTTVTTYKLMRKWSAGSYGLGEYVIDTSTTNDVSTYTDSENYSEKELSFTKSTTIDTSSQFKNGSDSITQKASYTSPIGGSCSITLKVNNITAINAYTGGAISTVSNSQQYETTKDSSGNLVYPTFELDQSDTIYKATYDTTTQVELKNASSILSNDSDTSFTGKAGHTTITLTDDTSIYCYVYWAKKAYEVETTVTKTATKEIVNQSITSFVDSGNNSHSGSSATETVNAYNTSDTKFTNISKVNVQYKIKTTTPTATKTTYYYDADTVTSATGDYENVVTTDENYTTKEFTTFASHSNAPSTSTSITNATSNYVETASVTISATDATNVSLSATFNHNVNKIASISLKQSKDLDANYGQIYSGSETFNLFKNDGTYGYLVIIMNYADSSITSRQISAETESNQSIINTLFDYTPSNGSNIPIGGNQVCTITLKDDTTISNTFYYGKSGTSYSGIATINYKLLKETSTYTIENYCTSTVGEQVYYLVPSNYLDSDNAPTSELTTAIFKQVCVGYVLLGSVENTETVTNARIVLFKNSAGEFDIANPSTDTNLIIKFPHYVNGYADKINKMTFGQLFDNRLFLGGNSDIKNIDYHSDVNGDDEQDLTYFSDLSYCAYGSDATALVGYDVFSDGDLIAFKEDSKLEPTMYYRTVAYMTATNSAGATVYDTDGNTLTEEQYPRYVLNQSGEGALTKDLICNYLGDTLLATKTGIKKLNTKSVSSNQHTDLVDVSKWINPKILKEDYSNAKLYTFERRLIIQTSRGIYIGERDLTTDNYNYEYFFQDIQTKDMFEYDGELYFIDSNNVLSKFTECEDNAKRIDTKLINLKTAAINTSNYTLNVENAIQTNIVEMLGNGYSIQLVDSIGVTYKDDYRSTKVLDENGSNQTINYTDQELFVVYDTTDKALHLKNRAGDVLTTDIVSSIATTSLTDKYAIAKGNVSAYYITKPFTFGNVNYQKTIQSYTIANDVALNSSINLEYLATNQLQIMTKQNVSGGGSDSIGNFKSSSFDKIQFTYDSLPHIYTRRLKIPRVNYIKFKFSNNDYYNAVLSQLTMTYITGQPNPKGVK